MSKTAPCFTPPLKPHFCLHFFVFCDILIKNFKGKEPSSFAKEGLFVSQWRERKGDEALWGHGLGKKALQAALKEIFLDMRKASILVHIKHGNTRSHNLFMNSGFSFVQERMQTTQYVLTFDRYLHPDKEKNLFIA